MFDVRRSDCIHLLADLAIELDSHTRSDACMTPLGEENSNSKLQPCLLLPENGMAIHPSAKLNGHTICIYSIYKGRRQQVYLSHLIHHPLKFHPIRQVPLEDPNFSLIPVQY